MSKRISNFDIQLYNSWCEAKSESSLAEYSYDKGRAEAIDECTKTIRKGFEELLQSPWANRKYLKEFDLAVKEVFEVIEHLILKKDIEQLKEQK